MTENAPESEEEILVYVEFEDSVNIEKYRTAHVLGIDGENPIIQMDETFFTGSYVDALGTYMFFEEDPDPVSSDPVFDKIAERNLKYLCKTRKLLSMEHAYVAPKEGHNQESHTQPEDEKIDAVNFNTIQEAIDTFKSNWDKIGENK